MSALAKRYARAAVEAAQDKGGAAGLEALAQGLVTFQQALDVSQELREVLENPALAPTREGALAKVLALLKIDGIAARVINVLAGNDRVGALADVAREVVAITDERAGRVRAMVKSATSLTDAQTQRLTRALEKRFGQKVIVEVTVSPELLGGIVSQVGDLTLDSSLRRQLSLMRERLLA